MKSKIKLSRKCIAILCVVLIGFGAVVYLAIQDLAKTADDTPDRAIPESAEIVVDGSEIDTKNSETDNEIGTENSEISETSISFEAVETEEVTETEEVAEETTTEILYEEPVYEEPTYNYEETYPETYGQEDPYVPYVYPAVQIALTDDEVYRLAALVQGEADAIYECKKAITSVVINRMVFYDMSFWDTITAPGQFISDWGTIPYKEPDEETLRAVNDVLTNGTTLPLYVLFYRAWYYHDWGDQVPYMSIGDSYFSYSYAHRLQVEQGGC